MTIDAEVHRLSRQLAARAFGDQKVGCTIRAAHREAVASVARGLGYELHTHAVEEHDRLWAEFWPAAAGTDPLADRSGRVVSPGPGRASSWPSR